MNVRMFKVRFSADAGASTGGGAATGTGNGTQQTVSTGDGSYSSTLDLDLGEVTPPSKTTTQQTVSTTTGNTGVGTVGDPANTGANAGATTGATGGVDPAKTGAAPDPNNPAGVVNPDPNAKGEGGEGGEGGGSEEEIPFVESVIETLGFDFFTEEDYQGFTNDEEGIAKVIQVASSRLAEQEIEADFQRFTRDNPEVVELMEAKRNGMLDQYYAAKANGGVIPEIALAQDNTEAHYRIILDNLISTGIPKEVAESIAKSSVDTGSSYATAKAIVDKRSADYTARQTEQAKLKAEQQARQEEANIARINKEVEAIRAGRIGDFIIPVARREAFIADYYKDAGNPDFPGKTGVGVKLATMSEVNKIKFAYYVHCGFNVDDAVQATIRRQSAESLKTPKSNAAIKGATGGTNDKNQTYNFDTPVVRV